MQLALTRLQKACALGTAVALHGLLVLPGLLSTGLPIARRPAPARTTEPLVITVVGRAGEHQIEAALAQRPPPPAPPLSAARPVPRQKAVIAKLPERTALHLLPPPPAEPAAAVAVAEPAAAPPPVLRMAEAEQPPQTVRLRAVEKDAIRRYIAGLSRAIQSRLVYPAEARDPASVGSPVIAFTLTEQGEIQAGSLRVYRSSGFDVLDQAALRAAQSSSPFEPPPQRMEIVVTVSFAQHP